MRKYLILKKDGNDLFFKNDENVKSYFKNKNLLFRIIKKIGLPLNIFFGDWKYELNNIDKVIFFDNGYNPQISKYIKSKNKDIRCVFWYWNSLIEYNNEIIKDENIDEIWTYNRFDAIKYGLKYNPQFYLLDNNKSESKEENNKKAIYLGRNKGRLNEINFIKDMLEKNNVECNFFVIEKEDELMGYEEYIERLMNSDIVVDVSKNTASGLSLRPLEALFTKKKLITNNTDIINYDFYHKNNIFVIGVDDKEKINDFLKTDYYDISDDVLNFYSYKCWLERILQDKK